MPDGQRRSSEHRATVLIVEDNADSRESLRLLLRLSGYDVAVAEDGQRGLEAIRSAQPDVAVVDIGLPGLDGYEVARRVRRDLQNEAIYLIALTGYSRSEDREAVLDAGFDVHVAKPPRHDELLRLISAAGRSVSPAGGPPVNMADR